MDSNQYNYYQLCTFPLILLLGNLVVSRKQRHLYNVNAIRIPSGLCLFLPWNALKLNECVKKAPCVTWTPHGKASLTHAKMGCVTGNVHVTFQHIRFWLSQESLPPTSILSFQLFKNTISHILSFY